MDHKFKLLFYNKLKVFSYEENENSSNQHLEIRQYFFNNFEVVSSANMNCKKSG